MGFQNGKLVRVACEALSGSGTAQVNVFHYDLIDDPVITGQENDPQLLADFFRDNVMTHVAALFDSGWTIQPVVVSEEKDPQNPNQARSQWTSGNALPGTRVVSGEALPWGVCGVAKWPTDHIGRRYTGRTFLGGALTESDQAGGVWTAGILGLWNAYLNAVPFQPDIQSGISEATANLCVYSRTARTLQVDPYAAHCKPHILRSKVYWLRSRES
jgi:hypothetical protein